MPVEPVSENRSFGDRQQAYRHPSKTCCCDMTFAADLPPQTRHGRVPVLWYLSGLTCTHENAMSKVGFQDHVARHGIAVIFLDTSPRSDAVSDDEDFDLGQGAGFYLNATRDPWSPHLRMYDDIVGELRALALEVMPVQVRHGITGHSMGGHGAITIALRNATMFDSLSAVAPIAQSTRSDWGRKQFSAYLGDDEAIWAEPDSTLLLDECGWKADILIDQGASNQFLDLIRPEALAKVMTRRRLPGQIRIQDDCDHSYFSVNSLARDHVDCHAERMI